MTEAKVVPLQTAYHVTHTHLVPAIKKHGIKTFQATNWVKGKSGGDRYGEGHIHAFEHPHDAARWAAKTDWAFNNKVGSGKVSIVKFKHDPKKWEEDTSDPLTQFGRKGKWLKSRSPVPAKHIVSHEPFTQQHVKQIIKANNAR